MLSHLEEQKRPLTPPKPGVKPMQMNYSATGLQQPNLDQQAMKLLLVLVVLHHGIASCMVTGSSDRVLRVAA